MNFKKIADASFKSQRWKVWGWSNEKLLHHSQHPKNQLNPCIHSADFRVSRTDQAHPKIIEIAFSFLKFAPAFQKSNHSITKQFWARFQKIIHFKIVKFHHNLTHFSSQLLRKRSYQLLMKWKPTDQQFPKACQCKY